MANLQELSADYVDLLQTEFYEAIFNSNSTAMATITIAMAREMEIAVVRSMAIAMVMAMALAMVRATVIATEML
ncbi:hypothetical protein BT96DRAFT_928026, partial [Gymnopus androsaceus JB14]